MCVAAQPTARQMLWACAVWQRGMACAGREGCGCGVCGGRCQAPCAEGWGAVGGWVEGALPLGLFACCCLQIGGGSLPSTGGASAPAPPLLDSSSAGITSVDTQRDSTFTPAASHHWNASLIRLFPRWTAQCPFSRHPHNRRVVAHRDDVARARAHRGLNAPQGCPQFEDKNVSVSTHLIFHWGEPKRVTGHSFASFAVSCCGRTPD